MGKFTSKKNGMSRYPERLQARGETPVTVRMPFIDRDGRHHGTMSGVLNNRSERDLEMSKGTR